MRRASRSTDQFNRSIGQASRGAIAGTLAFRGLGRSVAFASAAFLGGAGLTAAIRGSITAATNLQEQTTKTGVVFGDASRSVRLFSENALGLARDQALETASAFGALFRPLGLTGREAASLSIQMTKLGVDLASFSNTPVPDALAAIRSGLVGESEPLRRYGVLLSEARVQQQALATTGKKTAQELTNQEKVLARVALIMGDAEQASGDYERTIGGLANQQRELGKNIRNLQIQLGEALIPEVLRIVKQTNRWLENTENTDKVVQAFTTTLSIFTGVAETTINVIDGLADGFARFSSILDTLTPGRGSRYSLLDLGADLRDAGEAANNNGLLQLLGVLGGGGGRSVTGPDRGPGAVLNQLEALRTGRNLSQQAFGISGGSRAGRFAPKTRGLDAFLPDSVELALAQARTETQERAALGQELVAINRALRRDITHDDRVALEQEKTQIIQAIRSMNEAEARERQQAVNAAKRANEERVRAAKEAMDKLRQTVQDSIPDLALGVPGGPLTVGQVNAALAAREQQAQFRALGLTAAGDPFAPTGQALAGRADRLSERLRGTIFDTDQNRNQIARIRKVLSGQLGALTRETKQRIDEFLRAIEDPLKERGALGDPNFRRVSPNKLARQLGFTGRDATRRAAAILAQIGPGGTAPGGRSQAFGGVNFNAPVTINGITDIGKVEAEAQKRAQARPVVRRGAR